MMSDEPQVTFMGKRWALGEENPSAPEVLLTQDLGRVVFPCPDCLHELTFDTGEIEPVLGALLVCDTCGNVIFIPGSIRQARLAPGEAIRGGVLVPMKDLQDWYEHHPAFIKQVERDDVDLFGNFGLWLFCARCKHSFRGSVIQSWIFQNRNPRMIVFDFVDSRDKVTVGDLEGLQKGQCPSCSYIEVIGLMVQIPEYVIQTFGPKYSGPSE